jgi:hydrogenase nickel incorporation protein HypA/HybF
MHELPVTQSILDIVLKHARMNGVRRVHAINIAVGEMSDLQDEWIQKYFDYISKDTPAQGARLVIERTPVVFRCNSCNKNSAVKTGELKDFTCPKCGGADLSLVSGREYYIKDMEAE